MSDSEHATLPHSTDANNHASFLFATQKNILCCLGKFGYYSLNAPGLFGFDLERQKILSPLNYDNECLNNLSATTKKQFVSLLKYRGLIL